ncbi:MAG: ABC transporter ATP-binding protein [Sphingomonas sp.]|uniref:ABC transporter ATP-binding protein n=1 Tax=Sphingomonas sp. TaxID=28214 RepID=UPI0025D9D2DB|nr:ABC transporter ATP-binding protein [Sphingomonas sp.]MBX3563646.1 ABC transporter ATP-binding protein [Sphingomonas sp.]
MDSAEPRALAVETRQLIKRYGRETALAGVNLAVPRGGVYLLAGTNGAGKSSLLRALLNLERIDHGSAMVLGLDTGTGGPRIRARTGYVPETGEGTYRWMRAGRFLDHCASFYPNWDAEYAEHLIRLLEVRPEKRLGTLSKGQARRVQIVAALAHRPSLLLLDELTDGLDPLAREEVLSLLAAFLADTGCTAILSTHLVAEVETLIDHIGVLRAGRLVAQAPTALLLERLLRYHIDAPDSWSPPETLVPAILRRESGLGSASRLVAMGEERQIAAAIAASGAQVREVSRLSLAEAVPMLLQSEKSHDFA